MPDLSGPTYKSHPNNGCELQPSCLRCPLAQCIEDSEATQKRREAYSTEKVERNADILRLRGEGMAERTLARRFAVSLSRIKQICGRAKEREMK